MFPTVIKSFSLEIGKQNPFPSSKLRQDPLLPQRPSFESLQNTDLSILKKTLSLLALTSVKMIGELQALAMKVGRKGEDLPITYRSTFVAKTESLSNPIPRNFLVKSLQEFATGLEEDLLLCPVRAIETYLKCTSTYQNRPDSLFLSVRNNTRPLSKNAISYFLRETIMEASRPTDHFQQGVKPHSIRGVGTSLVFYKNFSVSRILELATWKSNSVFASFYLKDVQYMFENCRSLGPFVASGEIFQC